VKLLLDTRCGEWLQPNPLRPNYGNYIYMLDYTAGFIRHPRLGCPTLCLAK